MLSFPVTSVPDPMDVEAGSSERQDPDPAASLVTIPETSVTKSVLDALDRFFAST